MIVVTALALLFFAFIIAMLMLGFVTGDVEKPYGYESQWDGDRIAVTIIMTFLFFVMLCAMTFGK